MIFTSQSAKVNLVPSLNITSLLKDLDELRIILNKQNIDVSAINETRLDENISDLEVKEKQHLLFYYFLLL